MCLRFACMIAYRRARAARAQARLVSQRDPAKLLFLLGNLCEAAAAAAAAKALVKEAAASAEEETGAVGDEGGFIVKWGQEQVLERTCIHTNVWTGAGWTHQLARAGWGERDQSS